MANLVQDGFIVDKVKSIRILYTRDPPTQKAVHHITLSIQALKHKPVSILRCFEQHSEWKKDNWNCSKKLTIQCLGRHKTSSITSNVKEWYLFVAHREREQLSQVQQVEFLEKKLQVLPDIIELLNVAQILNLLFANLEEKIGIIKLKQGNIDDLIYW